jgi:hypothetical protein
LDKKTSATGAIAVAESAGAVRRLQDGGGVWWLQVLLAIMVAGCPGGWLYGLAGVCRLCCRRC